MPGAQWAKITAALDAARPAPAPRSADPFGVMPARYQPPPVQAASAGAPRALFGDPRQAPSVDPLSTPYEGVETYDYEGDDRQSLARLRGETAADREQPIRGLGFFDPLAALVNNQAQALGDVTVPWREGAGERWRERGEYFEDAAQGAGRFLGETAPRFLNENLLSGYAPLRDREGEHEERMDWAEDTSNRMARDVGIEVAEPIVVTADAPSLLTQARAHGDDWLWTGVENTRRESTTNRVMARQMAAEARAAGNEEEAQAWDRAAEDSAAMHALLTGTAATELTPLGLAPTALSGVRAIARTGLRAVGREVPDLLAAPAAARTPRPFAIDEADATIDGRPGPLTQEGRDFVGDTVGATGLGVAGGVLADRALRDEGIDDQTTVDDWVAPIVGTTLGLAAARQLPRAGEFIESLPGYGAATRYGGDYVRGSLEGNAVGIPLGLGAGAAVADGDAEERLTSPEALTGALAGYKLGGWAGAATRIGGRIASERGGPLIEGQATRVYRPNQFTEVFVEPDGRVVMKYQGGFESGGGSGAEGLQAMRGALSSLEEDIAATQRPSYHFTPGPDGAPDPRLADFYRNALSQRAPAGYQFSETPDGVMHLTRSGSGDPFAAPASGPTTARVGGESAQTGQWTIRAADTANTPASPHVLEAVDANGRVVGSLDVAHAQGPWAEGSGPYARGVFVEPEFRRQGVATALYRAAEQHFGRMVPSEAQNANAEAFWQSFRPQSNPSRNAPDGGGAQSGVINFGEQLNRDGSITPATPIDPNAADVRLADDLGLSDDKGDWALGAGTIGVGAGGASLLLGNEAEAQENAGEAIGMYGEAQDYFGPSWRLVAPRGGEIPSVQNLDVVAVNGDLAIMRDNVSGRVFQARVARDPGGGEYMDPASLSIRVLGELEPTGEGRTSTRGGDEEDAGGGEDWLAPMRPLASAATGIGAGLLMRGRFATPVTRAIGAGVTGGLTDWALGGEDAEPLVAGGLALGATAGGARVLDDAARESEFRSPAFAARRDAFAESLPAEAPMVRGMRVVEGGALGARGHIPFDEPMGSYQPRAIATPEEIAEGGYTVPLAQGMSQRDQFMALSPDDQIEWMNSVSSRERAMGARMDDAIEARNAPQIADEAAPEALPAPATGGDVPRNAIPEGAQLGAVRPMADGNEVRADIAQADEMVQTNWGANLQARAGRDYILTGPDGERWVVRRDIFENTYEPTESGGFRKSPDQIVRYWVSPDARTINTLEGPVEANPGDYVMVGSVGEMWPVRPEQFARKYSAPPAASEDPLAFPVGFYDPSTGDPLFGSTGRRAPPRAPRRPFDELAPTGQARRVGAASDQIAAAKELGVGEFQTGAAAMRAIRERAASDPSFTQMLRDRFPAIAAAILGGGAVASETMGRDPLGPIR